MYDQRGIVEALIFSSVKPLSLQEISVAANLSPKSAEGIIDELNEEYTTTGRSFRIESVAGGYKMFTLPEYHPYISRANKREKELRLSTAALEVLAIIAYKQPVTKAEIERIRGVDSDGVIKNLAGKSLVEIEGKSPGPGKPLLYATTDYFLEFFGLPSLEHLPPLAEVSDVKEGLPKLKLIKKAQTDKGEVASADDTDMLFSNLGINEKNSEDVVKITVGSHKQSLSDE